MSNSALTHNVIYTKICDAVLSVNENAYCSAVFNPVPASFPAVFVREVNRKVNRRYVDLECTDEQYTSTYQVQVFSNLKTGAMSEAYSILDAIKASFKKMYYIEDMERQLDNIDPSIYRLVAEFTRTIGSGDLTESPEVPTAQTEETDGE